MNKIEFMKYNKEIVQKSFNYRGENLWRQANILTFKNMKNYSFAKEACMLNNKDRRFR